MNISEFRQLYEDLNYVSTLSDVFAIVNLPIREHLQKKDPNPWPS
jgi:hypothetical protein